MKSPRSERERRERRSNIEVVVFTAIVMMMVWVLLLAMNHPATW